MPTGTETTIALAIVSILDLLASAVDHGGQPHNAYRDHEDSSSQKRSLRATRRPVQRSQPTQDQQQDDERERETGDLLRPVDSMGDVLVGRDGQQVTRVRVDQHPDGLTGERDHERPGNRPPGEGRTGPPSGEGEQQRHEECDPQLLQQQPERPQRVRARPFEVRAQKGEGSRS
jgi:hypothetical protein